MKHYILSSLARWWASVYNSDPERRRIERLAAEYILARGLWKAALAAYDARVLAQNEAHAEICREHGDRWYCPPQSQKE